MSDRDRITVSTEDTIMNRLKILLACLLALTAVEALAQTGVYYNPARTGEGVTVYDNGEQLLFYAYTYGAERCDVEPAPATVSTVCETVEVTATAECPVNSKGKPLCDPVVVTETAEVCATAEAEAQSKVCDNNGQRWFFGANDFNGIDSTGLLYSTEGMNFPKGVPNPEVWEGVILAEVFPVGLYLMEWLGRDSGYQLTVVPFGAGIPGDSLYSVHVFDTLLFEGY